MEDSNADWRHFPLVLVDTPGSWDDLPPPLMSDILSRLPAKTLIRSTAVNKSWYAFIKHPAFISEHLNRSLSNGDGFLLLTPESLSTSSPSCSLISENKSSSEIQTFDIPFTTKYGTVKILGSCNGLVFLTESFPLNFGRDVYIWNPSVKKYKKLADSCYPELLDHSGAFLKAMSVTPALGYGYHKLADDYRVVRVIYRADDTGDHFGKLDPRVEIYSLRADSWRKIKARVPNIVTYNAPMYLDGSIFWMKANNPNQPPPPYESVISFDLTTEVFREVKLPRDIRSGYKEYYNHVVVNFKGSIGVLVHGLSMDAGGCQRFSLWVMTEDGSSVPWARKLHFVVPFFSAGIPLKFSKTGKLILEGPLDKRSYHSYLIANLSFLDTDNLKVEKLADSGPYTLDTDFVESLVLFEGRKFATRV